MFPYRRATIDCGFEFVNDIESILNVPYGGGVSGPWGPGGVVHN